MSICTNAEYFLIYVQTQSCNHSGCGEVDKYFFELQILKSNTTTIIFGCILNIYCLLRHRVFLLILTQVGG